MRKTKPKPTREQQEEIERLRELASSYRQKKEKSFQRCDTDGFLSQWALGMNAEKLDREIRLLENGGYDQFPVLCDESGRVIADHIFEFENRFNYGTDQKWRLPDDLADRHGRKWIPVGSGSRIQKALGLHEELRWFKATACIRGNGTGLSGAATAFVTTRKLS
jgi:hypothetical protein